MSNVVNMPGKVLAGDQRGLEPNPDLIKSLETMLEEAKAGILQRIAYQKLYNCGSTRHGWVVFSKDDMIRLLGAGAVMNSDAGKAMCDEE